MTCVKYRRLSQLLSLPNKLCEEFISSGQKNNIFWCQKSRGQKLIQKYKIIVRMILFFYVSCLFCAHCKFFIHLKMNTRRKTHKNRLKPNKSVKCETLYRIFSETRAIYQTGFVIITSERLRWGQMIGCQNNTFLSPPCAKILRFTF